MNTVNENGGFEKLVWNTLLLMGVLVGIFMIEHFQIVSTPPTKAAHDYIMNNILP
jgi:hypothetical protein